MPEEKPDGFHGMKGAIPVWVGEPDQMKAVTAQNVRRPKNAAVQSSRRDHARLGLPPRRYGGGGATAPEQTDLNFIRLEQIRIDSPRFCKHVSALTTDHADYENFLTFVQPSRVEVGYKRISALTYIRCKRDRRDECGRENHQRAMGFQLPWPLHQHAGVLLRAWQQQGAGLTGPVRLPVIGQEGCRL